MFRLLVAAVALTPVLAFPASLHAQALTPDQIARIDAMVAEARARTGVPSVSIAVVRGGQLVLAKAYGKASEAIPVATPGLPYQIASNSKQFTAAAMLLLQRDGKLSLDDHVSRYLTGVTDGDRITLRQLLSHTSGLEDYWPQDYSFAAMAHPTTPQGIVDRWAKRPLDFQPGTQWQYSNTGYVVAGLIVEKVAGMPLMAFLQQRIFGPLGMKALDQDLAVGPRYPQGYTRAALGPVRLATPPARGWLFAAGELSMSAPDLAKWDIARMNRELLSPADWEAQETPVLLSTGAPNPYGLGVFRHDFHGHLEIDHGGEAVGFLTQNAVFPDDKAAVVVFTNADVSNTQDTLTDAIAEMILPPITTAGPPPEDETAKTAQAHREFEALRAGVPDRATMTADSNYYFTPQVLADYKASLSPLGEPTGFALIGAAKLRGGFVNRNYRITYPGGRTLTAITYAETGPQGRYEQFLVQPAN